jgi:hypothetical protein
MAMLSTTMDGYQFAAWVTIVVVWLAMSAHYRHLALAAPAARRTDGSDRFAAILRTASSSTVTYDTMHQAPTSV